MLFTERNLSLLPLLIGSQKYIAAFIERFPYLYIELKDQVVQLNELNKIGFFSVIALRKEQNLLDTVLIEYVLKDLEQVLQTSSFNPLYDVLETASLAKNKDFMKIVLDSLERYIDDQAKKDLLKKCIVTFLETAISQEHVSIVEYLCRERIEKKDPIIQEVYKEAFADEKIIKQIKNQVLKNINSAGNGRKEKKQKIYDLVLQAASYTGSTDFIIKVLDLIKNDPKFLSDTDRQTFLQNSLVTILDNVIREKHFSIIQNVYTNFVLKLAENSGVEFLTIQQRYQNACHTSISVDNNVAGQFNEEPNGDDSNLEQDEFEITDIQEEQGLSVLGSNRTEIAGFSQEKLLEIIDFVKIGYYVSDYNLNNKKFSELEKRSYKVPAKLKEEGYKIVQFDNVNDGKQYRHAGYVFIKDNEITIVYRGSRNLFDYITDIRIPLICAPELLPEGGKIHSGFYSLFKDSWESVYKILKGYANDQQLEIKDFKINLTGHSMGGAIATIAALFLSVREGAEDLHVATFASPRVFDSAAAEVYEERLEKKTIRVVNQSDFIPSLPLGSMGYKHVGEQLRISSSSSLYAHPLDVYRNLIANLEPDQFKSDNSVSIYYYLSYLVTVLYNVSTVPSYLIPNTHSNGDEQYFKQVKNKHKDASLSEMMKYSGSSNEQKVVIYEDSEPGEDGFITFHTLRNAIDEKNLLTISLIFNPNIECRITKSLIDNLFATMPSPHRYGRSKGLKVNVSSGIASSINSNHYLNENNIGLKQLCAIENIPIKGVSDSTGAENRFPGSKNIISDSAIDDEKKQAPGQLARNVPEKSAGNIKTDATLLLNGDGKQSKILANGAGCDMGDVTITETGNADVLHVVPYSSGATVLPVSLTASDIIEGLKDLPNNSTLDVKFSFSNGQGIAQIFKKSDRKIELFFPGSDPYELDLHLINEESLKVLFNKENLINEQASIQFAGHVIQEDSIQVLQPKSLVNIRDNNVQLVDESDQPIQEGNGIALMDYLEDDEHFYDAVESQGTNSEGTQVNNTQGGNEHHSNITANTNDESVSTTTNDQLTSIISSNGEDKQSPVQQASLVPKESGELAAEIPQGTSVEGDVTKNDDVATSVSSDDNHSNSSEIQLGESRTGSDQISNQSTGHITQMDDERAPLSEGNFKLESNQRDLQPEVLPIVLNGNPNNIAVTNGNIKMPILEQKSDTKTNGKQSTNPNNGGVTAPSVQLAAPKSVDKNSGKKDTQPKLIPTGVPLVASKDSNRVNNVQGNSKQPSYPGKNNPAPQNAKSKLPVIAASMLAITGVATGIAIAVYLEMLMVGIAVGACCLVAAAIIYYCNRPSNLLEGSNVESPAISASAPIAQ